MFCAPVRSIIPSLKLGDHLSVQAHKPCSISHLNFQLVRYKNTAILRENVIGFAIQRLLTSF